MRLIASAKRTPCKWIVCAIALSTTSLLSLLALPAHTRECSNLEPTTQSTQSCSTPETPTVPSERVLIPGTSVSLSPPPGFVLSDQFSGFVNPDSFSSIVLVEMPPEAYSDLAAIFSDTPAAIDEAFAERGITIETESVSTLSVQEGAIPWVIATQFADGIRVKKYFGLLGKDGESTQLLTVNVIEPDPLSEDTIITAVSSIEISPTLSLSEKAAALPFTFETAEPFQLFEVLAGSSVLLNLTGEVDPSGQAPLIIIANSLSSVQPASLSALATNLLQNTDGFANADIVEQSAVEFAGQTGDFIRATLPKESSSESAAETSDTSTILQYLAILPDDFYIRLIVLGNAEELETLMPTIQTIQSSVEAQP
ncbi:MAG: hypothetical protein AAFO06_22260 [Cyanobacteria bacterium J06597_16]